MNFGEKLSQLMRRGGLSDRKMAQIIELSPKAVGNLRRDAAPRPDTARRIAEHFKLPIEVLLDPDRELPPTKFDVFLGELEAARERADGTHPTDKPAAKALFNVLLAEQGERAEKRLLAEKLRGWAAEMLAYAERLDPPNKPLV